jgi:hypothetical protein
VLLLLVSLAGLQHAAQQQSTFGKQALVCWYWFLYKISAASGVGGFDMNRSNIAGACNVSISGKMGPQSPMGYWTPHQSHNQSLFTSQDHGASCSVTETLPGRGGGATSLILSEASTR